MTKSLDCIIIGGGHNALVCAAYLAKGGRKVTVLEKRDVLGGCASTEELWPGFKVSVASYVISLFQPQIIKDLKLKENGLKILPRNPSSFTPDLNGPGLVLGRDSKRNYEELFYYSEEDAINYPKYEKYLENIVEKIEPLFSKIPPNVLPSSGKQSFFKKIPELFKAYSMGKELSSLGDQFFDAFELIAQDATTILERWFESDILKTTLATDAIIGSFNSPSQKGSAYVLFHHVMGKTGGARGVWGYVQGGMGGIANALEKTCNDLDVAIKDKIEVRNLEINDQGRVTAVNTNNGTFEADIVVSTLDANLTFKHLVGYDNLPEEFANRVDNIDYSSASMKINLALDKLPNFTTKKRDYPFLTGTTHIPSSMKKIEEAFDDAKYGNPSKYPVLEISIPTTVDDTIAPEGKHIMGIFVQYFPYELHPRYKEIDNLKDSFADKCIDIINDHAPGFKDSILYKQVLSPLDLEKKYGLTEGNIFQGSMDLSNIGPFRPVMGWNYRTPIKGLYIGGASAPPGGGVMGIPGKNAAEVILRDTS